MLGQKNLKAVWTTIYIYIYLMFVVSFSGYPDRKQLWRTSLDLKEKFQNLKGRVIWLSCTEWGWNTDTKSAVCCHSLITHELFIHNFLDCFWLNADVPSSQCSYNQTFSRIICSYPAPSGLPTMYSSLLELRPSTLPLDMLFFSFLLPSKHYRFLKRASFFA